MRITIEKEVGALPSVSEMEIVDILVTSKIPNQRVVFLKPSRAKGSKTPDLLIDDLYWEIKSVERLGKYTLDHALRAGLRQSENLIIDLRKLNKAFETKALTKVEKEFNITRGWRGLIVVVRSGGDCLTFKK